MNFYILKGPGNSIDLHGKSEKCEILLNINEKERKVNFYTDDYSENNKMRGEITSFGDLIKLLLFIYKLETGQDLDIYKEVEDD